MVIKLPRRAANNPRPGRYTSELVPVIDGKPVRLACVHVIAPAKDPQRVRIGYSRGIAVLKNTLKFYRCRDRGLDLGLYHIAWVRSERHAQYLAARCRTLLTTIQKPRIEGPWYWITPQQAWHVIEEAAKQRPPIAIASHDDYISNCVPRDELALDAFFGAR
jgi:hypothetical protein